MKKTLSLLMGLLCVIGLSAQTSTEGKWITSDAGEQIPWQKPVKIPLLNESKGSNSLTTLFNNNNGHTGNMFDIQVLNPNNITITSIDVSMHEGETGNVSVYYKSGSYIGSETNSAAWTLLGTVPGVTSSGENTPTPVDIPDLELSAGQSYGLYVVLSRNILSYSDDPGKASSTHTQFSNADLILTSGNGMGFFSNVWDYRIWNGTIYYSGDAVFLPLSSWMIVLGLVLLAGIAVVGRRFL